MNTSSARLYFSCARAQAARLTHEAGAELIQHVRTCLPDSIVIADEVQQLCNSLQAGQPFYLPALLELNTDQLAPLRTWCSMADWDVAYFAAPLSWSDFRLIVFDMDSTLIQIECVDELADFAGKKSEVAAITEAAMHGRITDYAQSLRQRVALLEGLKLSALEAVLRERLRLTPGAQSLIDAAKKAGLRVAIASGGFTFFTEALKRQLPIDAVFANVLGIHDGRLTGELVGPIVDAAAKARALRQCCAQWGFSPSQAIAIGDGANDLAMMQAAGLSVAFHAKPAVRQAAHQQVNAGGLEVVAGWLR